MSVIEWMFKGYGENWLNTKSSQAKPSSLTKTQADSSRDERHSENTGVMNMVVYTGLLKKPG